MTRLENRHIEILLTIKNMRSGAWEVISARDAEECAKAGWLVVRQDNGRYALTGEGEQILEEVSRHGALGKNSAS